MLPLRHQLTPLALEFAELHPNVTLRMQVGSGFDYFSQRDLDIALRFGPQPESDWVARKLARNPSVLCASAELAAKLSTITPALAHPKQLNEHPYSVSTTSCRGFSSPQRCAKVQFIPTARL